VAVVPAGMAATSHQLRLTPDEHKVWEYTVGAFGKPPLRPAEIAKQLGLNPSKVSRLRKSIRDKMRHVNGG
jgi:DNA-binding CsgD family transcriptional regulator